MVQKRRKSPKKRNSTEEREPSDGSKATNHADTAKSIGGSPRTEWMKRWKCATEAIGLFANVATIVAIVLTGYQIVVGNLYAGIRQERRIQGWFRGPQR